MNDKKHENQLLVAQIAWEALDSLGDKIIEESIEGMAGDLLSAFPGGTIALGVYKGLRSYNDKKKFKNFVSFIKTYKTKTDKEIYQYLNENPNTEIGEYTVTLIEELTSSRQTEMLGRATALLLNSSIDENMFYEYGYIISKIDPYLFSLIRELEERNVLKENGREDLQKMHELSKRRKSFVIKNPNQDLLSFGFLDAIPIDISGAGTEKLPEQRYKVNQKFNVFYRRIILGGDESA